MGGVKIGGGAPVAVQSMTKTETADYEATMRQIRAIADAGADLVRVAVPRDDDVKALERIVVESPIPVIADIHFNHTLALKAIDAGAHCIRLNPGNIGGREKVAEVAEKANAKGVPMRIGVNSGSLPKHLHALERENPVEALVAAAVLPLGAVAVGPLLLLVLLLHGRRRGRLRVGGAAVAGRQGDGRNGEGARSERDGESGSSHACSL